MLAKTRDCRILREGGDAPPVRSTWLGHHVLYIPHYFGLDCSRTSSIENYICE